VGTSQINFLASSSFTEQHAPSSEPQWSASTVPAVFLVATPSADFSYSRPAIAINSRPVTSRAPPQASHYANGYPRLLRTVKRKQPPRSLSTAIPLRIPGELLTPNAHPVEPAHLITQLRKQMARLSPFPATRHANPGTFIHKDLTNCTHVFLRQDSTRRVLKPPYSGPHQVLSLKDKTLKLLVRGKPTGSSPFTTTTVEPLLSNLRPPQPQPKHLHQPKLHAPDAKSVVPYATPPNQHLPRGGGWCGSLLWNPPTRCEHR
jgi:hypothetical protein